VAWRTGKLGGCGAFDDHHIFTDGCGLGAQEALSASHVQRLVADVGGKALPWLADLLFYQPMATLEGWGRSVSRVAVRDWGGASSGGQWKGRAPRVSLFFFAANVLFRHK